MTETSITRRAAWRRENATHHYTGSLTASRDGLRLAGRDAATGIGVTLTIPAEEIEHVRVSASWDERVVGEACAVLELSNSTPILLREIGCGALDPDGLAAALAGLLHGVGAGA